MTESARTDVSPGDIPGTGRWAIVKRTAKEFKQAAAMAKLSKAPAAKKTAAAKKAPAAKKRTARKTAAA